MSCRKFFNIILLFIVCSIGLSIYNNLLDYANYVYNNVLTDTQRGFLNIGIIIIIASWFAFIDPRFNNIL
jgi:hypothetical protein